MTDNPYASIDDIFACSDLQEQDVTAYAWKRSGAPMQLRVRGVPLETIENIKLASQGSKAKLVAGYLHEGFINPRITLSQAEQLVRDKHAGQVEQLAGLIITLSEIDYESIAAEAKRIAGMDTSTKPANDSSVE